jgi:hypothetical protein
MKVDQKIRVQIVDSVYELYGDQDRDDFVTLRNNQTSGLELWRKHPGNVGYSIVIEGHEYSYVKDVEYPKEFDDDSSY